jgi:DNA-binding NarL/FixJ family response regulator
MNASGFHAGGALRILLADDDPLFAEGMAALLSSAERLDVVGHAVNGDEAVEMTRSLRPDVVLMDISMPRSDGIEATRRIKASVPATVVLVLTSSRSDEDIRSAARAGAAGYLTKESVTSDLATTILEVAAMAAGSPQRVATGNDEPFANGSRS